MRVLSVTLSLISALALVNGAYTPRSRNIHKRHAAILHARAPVPAPAPAGPLKKRDTKKCRARPTSSSLAPTTSLVAPANPGADPTPTPKEVKPTTTPAPTPTEVPHTTHKPSPSPSPQPKPTQPSNSGGGDGNSGGSNPFGGFFAGPQSGDLTYYALGLTACGQTYSDSDYVAAVSQLLFDVVPGAGANPNNNPVCNKKVNVTYQGKTITVKIVDRCTGCAPTDLDLSPSAFSALASQSIGRITSGVKWEWA